MKFYFAFFVGIVANTIFAQSIFNTDLIKKIDKSLSTEKINVLLLCKPHTEINFFEFNAVTLHYLAGNIYSITGTIKSVLQLAKHKNVIRIEYTEHKLQLMADTCLVRNRIKGIKLGLAPLSQSYDGTGVIIGIIDSGTDFNHPDFKDINGHSRIKYLWDMTKPTSVNTPSAFGYGQDWNNSEIDLGLCTHNDLANYGHGTNSTGIAAGNGYSVNKYQGIASNADIIAVALDFNRPGFIIADALQYIVTKAQQLNKPLVVNASVGDYYGSHDGTNLEAQIIDNLIKNTPGRALVASCGNGGSTNFHVGYNIISSDTNFTWIRNNSNAFSFAEYSDTNQIKNVKFQIGVTRPNFTDVGNTNFKTYNYALNTIKKDTIYKNSHRIGIVTSVASINSFGVYELDITIQADSLNYLWSIAHTGTGRIDSWNFDYVSTNLPPITTYPKIVKYKMPDNLQTIVSSFQCSDEVIAVGNYVNRNHYVDVNNTLQTTTEVPGQLQYTSSFGPTRDNRIKPDISASGATILTSSPLAHIMNLKINAPYLVAQGGFHVTAGGTSASSPVVAGFAALYFQKNPTATNRDLKQAIINCAYSDFFTTTALPNNKWGYGKLDGFASMLCGTTTNIKVVSQANGIQVFPNPLTNETTILFSNSDLKKITLINSSGQIVLQDECNSSHYLLERSNLAAGLYLLVCDDKLMTHKVKILML